MNNNNGFPPTGLVITTDQTMQNTVPIYNVDPGYVHTVDPNYVQTQYLPVTEDVHEQVSLDQEYDVGLGCNLRDPQFVSQFDGHLNEPPPIGPWISEATQLALKYFWAYALWTIFYVVCTGLQYVPNTFHSSTVFLWLLTVLLWFILISIQAVSFLTGVAFSFKVIKDKNGPQLSVGSQISLLLTTTKEIIINYQLVLRTIAVVILTTLAVFLGLICLILPGFWLLISFTLSNYILVEHHQELPSCVVDSMRLSKNIVNKYFCNWFLLLIVLGLMYIFIIPIPIIFLVLAIAVRETVGLRPEM